MIDVKGEKKKASGIFRWLGISRHKIREAGAVDIWMRMSEVTLERGLGLEGFDEVRGEDGGWDVLR